MSCSSVHFSTAFSSFPFVLFKSKVTRRNYRKILALSIIQGSIVISKIDGNYTDQNYAYFVTGNPSNVVALPISYGEKIFEFAVSPNGRLLAYRRASINKPERGVLEIINATGETQHSLAWESGWVDFDWLGNGKLAISRFGSFGVLVLNLENMQFQELYPGFSDFFTTSDPFPNWGMYEIPRTVYDSELSVIVYPAQYTKMSGWPVILWDMTANRENARLTTYDSYGGTPKWSPDGNRLLIAADTFPTFPRSPYFSADELYTIDRHGEITRLTHLSEYYKYVEIVFYDWSPDNQRVAFWVVAEPNLKEDHPRGGEMQLAVLDTATGEVMNYCLFGERWPNHPPLKNDSAPLWSPDGTQLIIISPDLNDITRRRVILVDIVNNYAAVIAENVEPVGWMIAP